MPEIQTPWNKESKSFRESGICLHFFENGVYTFIFLSLRFMITQITHFFFLKMLIYLIEVWLTCNAVLVSSVLRSDSDI